jgi:hypothetical protein
MTNGSPYFNNGKQEGEFAEIVAIGTAIFLGIVIIKFIIEFIKLL